MPTLAPRGRGRTKQPAGARRAAIAARNPKSLVDEMLGIAELRAPAPGSDPLYNALHTRHVARR